LVDRCMNPAVSLTLTEVGYLSSSYLYLCWPGFLGSVLSEYKQHHDALMRKEMKRAPSVHLCSYLSSDLIPALSSTQEALNIPSSNTLPHLNLPHTHTHRHTQTHTHTHCRFTRGDERSRAPHFLWDATLSASIKHYIPAAYMIYNV